MFNLFTGLRRALPIFSYVRSIMNITNKPYQFPFGVTFTTIVFFKPKKY